MTKLIGRFARLNLGFVLYALGIVLTIQANIGYAPWDVFHAGFSQTTGLSFGKQHHHRHSHYCYSLPV